MRNPKSLQSRKLTSTITIMKNLKKLPRSKLKSLKGGDTWSCYSNACPPGNCCRPGRWPDVLRSCYICADS
ncbi:bacteriocin-like protein [Chryseobacterium defluvii]|uniref:bacteriocin-like protein n=1 Tax=Chryseobacterium defluvii TaxID=160396 RepID=UPI003977E0AF